MRGITQNRASADIVHRPEVVCMCSFVRRRLTWHHLRIASMTSHRRAKLRNEGFTWAEVIDPFGGLQTRSRDPFGQKVILPKNPGNLIRR